MEPVSEKRRHDEVNLKRLIRRLEKSVANENWEEVVSEDDAAWRKASSTLQMVRFAKSLLKNVELSEDDYSNVTHYDDIKASLDRMEKILKPVQERTAPRPRRPKSLLAQIPIPVVPAPSDIPSTEADADSAVPTASEDNLFMSPSDSQTVPFTSFVSPIPSLIPPTLPAAASSSTAVATGSNSHFLQNSKAQQEELKSQLAQMSTQLRRNAMIFSEKLAEDQAVVEGTQEKLESNFDVMKSTRVQVRDLRGKTGSTTCLVIFSVLGVTVLFMLMVFIMRLT